MPPRGRPRALDEVRQREICALVSAGCSLREAARYVRCSHATIQREAERNPEFRRRLDASALTADLTPLQAMQQAVGKHWRAAAWMLERTKPDRFGRREPHFVRPRQARQLIADLHQFVDAEVTDPLVGPRLKQRIQEAIVELVPEAANPRRASGDAVRDAIKFFRDKDARREPDATADATSAAGRPSAVADALKNVAAGIREHADAGPAAGIPPLAPSKRPRPQHRPTGDPFLRLDEPRPDEGFRPLSEPLSTVTYPPPNTGPEIQKS